MRRYVIWHGCWWDSDIEFIRAKRTGIYNVSFKTAPLSFRVGG